jgi:hypothetical protein
MLRHPEATFWAFFFDVLAWISLWSTEYWNGVRGLGWRSPFYVCSRFDIE